MSKNFNRARVKAARTHKEYKALMIRFEYNYCYICNRRAGSHFYDCHPEPVFGRHGNGKPIYSYQRRAYRSWKHQKKKNQWN